MFHGLYSRCWQDGSSEPALGIVSLGAVRNPNMLGLNGGLGYVTVMWTLAAVYYPQLNL